MKHTQGEWKHTIEKDGMLINDVIKNKNQYLATIHVTGPEEEWKANAKLIAAAPDLLDALNQLMHVYETKGQLLAFDVNIARQAIEKATL